MPEILLYFNQDINDSAMVGDVAYYCDIQSNNESVESNFDLSGSSMIPLGTITYISPDRKTLGANVLGSITNQSAVDKFIFFSKDNAVNMSSPLGYFAKARITNNSKVKSEIFSIACDVFESSK